jgi:DNA-binding beta-propeller fold protein YncE
MKNALPFLLSVGFAVSASAQGSAGLKPARAIPLPGVQGRLGHLQFDAQRQRLYVAASDNNSVEVLDVQKATRLRPLSVSAPSGLWFLPRPNLLYVSSAKDGHVKVFDCAAERAIKTIGQLPGAGNVRFDAPANRIYVAYDRALGMLNAQTGVHTVTTPLAGLPEAFVIEPAGDRIFVNVPAQRQVVVIERLSREVAASWPLENWGGNSALALDEANGRLFVGCRLPPRLLVLDAKTGKHLADCEIAGDVDDLAYDGKRRRLYASCGEGFLEVIDQADADHYKPQPRLSTAKGARTSLLAEESDLLFLAVPAQADKPAEIRLYRLAP